jgi:cellulose synthase/poly-beta-1,6-N-acetylglucosamine synthase-like glycosyltransferase
VEFLFWLLVTAVAWCYVGYPLFIGLAARFRPRPVLADGRCRPTVTVIVAVRNERESLPRRLTNLLSLDYPPDRLDVVVVGNGSQDGSEDVAREVAARDPRVRVFTSPAEQGKSGAINLAASSAASEVLVFADARQTFAPDAIARLVEPFADAAVGAVTGRLLVRPADQASVEGMRLYWGLETRLRDAEGRTGSIVGATGAIYAARRALFETMPPNLILDDVYLPLRIAMRGYRVVMATEALAFDVPARDQRAEFTRKRRTMVGNIQLLSAIPGLLSPLRNPLFFRYVSHKLLRLATPFCFVALLAVSALLPEWPYRAFFAMELTAYALGFLAMRLSLSVLSIPAAFVLMHVAIFAAIRRWNQDAGSVWGQPTRSGVTLSTAGSVTESRP